jgi:S1-C subfamily serine protease
MQGVGPSDPSTKENTVSQTASTVNETITQPMRTTTQRPTRGVQSRRRNRRAALAATSRTPSVTEATSDAATNLTARGFLGVRLDVLAPDDGNGAEVVQTVPCSPAADAGLEDRDRITSFGRRRVTSTDDLVEALASHHPGDDVGVVWRTPRGTAHVARVRLAQRSPHEVLSWVRVIRCSLS